MMVPYCTVYIVYTLPNLRIPKANLTEFVATKLDGKESWLINHSSVQPFILKIENKGMPGLRPRYRAHTQHNTPKSDDGVKGACGNRQGGGGTRRGVPVSNDPLGDLVQGPLGKCLWVEPPKMAKC